jgi:hypothetical protein
MSNANGVSATVNTSRGPVTVRVIDGKLYADGSGGQQYLISGRATHCECRGFASHGHCKHLTAARASGLVHALPDDGMLDGDEFDADAGRDVMSELEYIRSGREKRNYGC